MNQPCCTKLRWMALSLSMLFPVSYAQEVATNVSSTVGTGDLETTITQDGNVHTITGGTRPNNGPNLFHSFEQFSVGTNATANFQNETGLATDNILGRVTGGSLSEVDGLIQTTEFSGADLFLINPQGFMFGPNASLDVEGSFHVSTADYVKLEDGLQFNAVPSSDDALLSTAPPEAFGFLDQPNGDITVSESDLRVPEDESLSLVGELQVLFPGSDFEIALEKVRVQSGILDAPGGHINIAQVPLGSEFPINPPPIEPSTQGSEELNLPQDFSEQDIVIRSGIVTVAGGAVVGQEGGNINIDVGKLELIEGGKLESFAPADSNAGNIIINATDAVEIGGRTGLTQSRIRADVSSDGINDREAGFIYINAPRIEIDDGIVGAGAFSSGIGGEIIFEADTIDILNGGSILTQNAGGQSGGSIRLTADDSVSIQGGSNVNSVTSGEGNAGSIIVQADRLDLAEGGQISTSAEAGQGDAGQITLEVNELRIDEGGLVTSGTFEASSGNGGNILVMGSSDVDIQDGQISTSTLGEGMAGEIEFKDVSQLSIGLGGLVSSSTSGQGDGGIVSVDALRLNVQGGEISTSANQAATGAAGEIQIKNVDRLTIDSGGSIASNTESPERGGKIVINANEIFITDSGSSVSATTKAIGQGGDIEVNAVQLEIRDGGGISAGSTSTDVNREQQEGRSGTIDINVSDTFRIFDGGEVSVETAESDAGDIDIEVISLLHLRDGRITTSAALDEMGEGTGNGGNITIDPVFVVLEQGSTISANARKGVAGDIDITTTGSLFRSFDSNIVASNDRNLNGNIQINSPDTDVIAGTLELPESYLNVATLLGDHCAAEALKTTSSLVVTGRGGVPPSPERVLRGSAAGSYSTACPSVHGE